VALQKSRANPSSSTRRPIARHRSELPLFACVIDSAMRQQSAAARPPMDRPTPGEVGPKLLFKTVI
jgi:hypothetical protein